MLRLRGGFTPSGFNFNSCEDQVNGSFAKNAPDWRVVVDGLNMEGPHPSDSCKASGQKDVIAHFGIGSYNIGQLQASSKCMLCKTALSDVHNMIFSRCGFTIEGEQEGKNDAIKKESRTPPDGFSTFKDETDAEMVKWKWMQVTTKH